MSHSVQTDNAAIAVNTATPPPVVSAPTAEQWSTATPESQGFDSTKLAALWQDLQQRQTSALLVLCNDHVIFEQYAAGYTRTQPHGTASLAKAVVGGLSLMVAMQDGRLQSDDLASKYVPQWANDPLKRSITIRHLATHTSGLEDAESAGEVELPHNQLNGWKGDFWKYLAPPDDPFSLARDRVPVLDVPGTNARYSNPGMAMLGYCITGSLQGAPDADLRALLRHRIMEPLGVPEREWSCGYGKPTLLDGKSLIATWGGGSYSPHALACIGQMMLHQGMWQGRQLLTPAIVHTATTYVGMPNHAGLGWWVNRNPDGSRYWKAVPDDAFWGAGAGHQLLLIIPTLHLVVVRNGQALSSGDYNSSLEQHLITPFMQTYTATISPLAPPHNEPTAGAPSAHQTLINDPHRAPSKSTSTAALTAPYPPSPVIQDIVWAPADTIVRRAPGSDNWPVTWGDDDRLYTAYGDGSGFDPTAPRQSLGLARINGGPLDLTATNLPAVTGTVPGSGVRGQKASGLLMVQGILYLLARNSGNTQLAWSSDRGLTWKWCDWKFTTSFGYPAFLNYGQNYNGAHDHYVYLYSPDTPSAYQPADSMVLARVPQDHITQRNAYEFWQGFNAQGQPVWNQNIAARGAIFAFPGHCLRSQISYDAAIGRYIWWQQLPDTAHPREAGGPNDQADTRYHGGFGIYDAPTPWGPWTTAYFTPQWDVGPGENANFPTKWMSADGTTLYLVFSGNDSFSVRKATLILKHQRPVK